MKIKEVANFLESFTYNFNSMIIATNPTCYPYGSYAPVIKKDNKFYIIVSKRAPHYEGLMKGKVSGLFVENENVATNIFFRKRLHYIFDSKVCHDREIKELFIEVHGHVADIVVNLGFIIFELTIKEGKLVLGPGETYKINSNNVIEDIN